MKRFGLLGHPLSHSLSPRLHAMLGSYSYSLYDTAPDELASFLKETALDGFNVTRPYKIAVIPHLSALSPLAERLGSVNTVVRREDGSLWGDNTDYEGFRFLLRELPFSPVGKKALILGSGGAAVCVRAALQDAGAHPVMISRSGDGRYHAPEEHRDASVIINATPLGQLPYSQEQPLILSPFRELKAVIDLNYNPLRSRLLLEAEKLGACAVGGLPMLAAQALAASRLWGVCEKNEKDLPFLIRTLQNHLENIVLIGMPGCGKSTLAYHLGARLERPVYDTDELFEKERGESAAEFLKREGEEAFRLAESELLSRLASVSGAVIACGGGAATREENYAPLRQNGRIFWIQRNLGELDIQNRPLSAAQPLEQLYEARKDAYQRFADHIIPPQENINESLARILEVVT